MEGNGKPTEPEVAAINAYMENMRIMNSIAAEMKEIPVLPSEKPTDVNPLEKVEFPEEGGVLTYMGGYEYPYRGFPMFEVVEKIDVIKKIGRAAVSGLYHSMTRRKYWLFTLLPAVWVFKELFYTGVSTFYRLIERVRIKPIRYSRAVRELHRVFSTPRGEDQRTQDLRLMLRDIVCMVLEYDNAYRFRAQDLLPELRKEALVRNPYKELNRILTIAQSRERTQEVSDTWKLGKVFVSVYLRFDRKLRNIVVGLLSDLDVSQFELTIEDKQFADKRRDYVFGFQTNVSN